MKEREKSAVGDCSAVAKEAKAKGEEFTVVKLEVGTNAKLGRQVRVCVRVCTVLDKLHKIVRTAAK